MTFEITEINNKFWADQPGYEFIELYNAGNTVVDLGGFALYAVNWASFGSCIVTASQDLIGECNTNEVEPEWLESTYIECCGEDVEDCTECVHMFSVYNQESECCDWDNSLCPDTNTWLPPNQLPNYSLNPGEFVVLCQDDEKYPGCIQWPEGGIIINEGERITLRDPNDALVLDNAIRRKGTK